MTRSEDRVRGALYGVAVGDALGAPLEFMNATRPSGRWIDAFADLTSF